MNIQEYYKEYLKIIKETVQEHKNLGSIKSDTSLDSQMILCEVKHKLYKKLCSYSLCNPIEIGFTPSGDSSSKEYEKYYIKFYLQVPEDARMDFMREYDNFIMENRLHNNCEIRGKYRLKLNAISSDMITVSVYDPEYYQKVFDFLSDYVVDKNTQHIFMPTINGIGVTIDAGDDYNKYIANKLCDYFRERNSINVVSNDDFLFYVRHSVCYDNKTHHPVNLANAFNKDLTLSDVTNIIKKSQNHMKNYPLNSKLTELISWAVTEMGKCMIQNDISGAFEILENVIFNENIKEQVKKAFEMHIKEIDLNYNATDVIDYLKKQLLTIDKNAQRVAKQLEKIYKKQGIEGVKQFLKNLDIIIAVNLADNNLIHETFIPYLYEDIFDLYEDKVEESNYGIKMNNVTYGNIYGKLTKDKYDDSSIDDDISNIRVLQYFQSKEEINCKKKNK